MNTTDLYKASAQIRGFRKLPYLSVIVDDNATYITNLYNVCEKIKREKMHVMGFLGSKFQCSRYSTSLVGLLVKKVPQKDMEQAYTEYIIKYVMCRKCRNFNTKFTKKGVVCNECK